MLRSHKNNELRIKDVNQEVSLCGWVMRMRDHGGVNFVDLRDRWGITQVVFNPDMNLELHKKSQSLRSEFCIQVSGVVRERPEGTHNDELPTGTVEVEANKLVIFSKSKTPPFEIDSKEKQAEDLRLKYRFLDLRKENMQNNMLYRHKLIFETRNYLNAKEFVEIETPILTKSTPEGARDYLVPSRVHEGEFFALPQSPQLFKQLLMVSGYDRYFQIAKCFRDEDLRADRQPEFTQIDLEMSFVDEEDVYREIENLILHLDSTVLGRKISSPFLRLSYENAMSCYGSDKPDLRFDMQICDVSPVFKNTTLRIFKETLASEGVILALHVSEPNKTFSRKDFDNLIQLAKDNGAGGLAYIKVTADGLESPIAKFFSQEEIAALKSSLPQAVKDGDVIFFGADKKRIAQNVLGQARIALGRQLGLIDDSALSWVWVTGFPLFKQGEKAGQWTSEHHPFTGPHPEDLDKIGVDNGSIRSLSYDLVLNGNEIASGSVRIHDPEVQKKVFDVIGLDPEEAMTRFGFLLDAFEYGPPPHAGLAIGVDRLVAIALGLDSIRDVIAFPKTQKAVCTLTDAPSVVNAIQLKELGIKLS